MFEEFAEIIQQKYPALKIMGDNYPPPLMHAYAAQFLGVAKFILLIAILSGQNPFVWFGMEAPGFYTWAIENKVFII